MGRFCNSEPSDLAQQASLISRYSVRIGNSRRVPLDAVNEFIARLEKEAGFGLYESNARAVIQ